jgi:2-methylcitrate dehydratase
MSSTDAISTAITGFVVDQRQRPVSDAALHEARRRLLDSLGCAIAAMDSPAAQIARGLAADSTDSTGTHGATVIGLDRPSTVELATFANTVMVRYLDCNDAYFTARGGGGHPSDVIATALAVAESVGASGLDALRSIVLGYEIIGALATGVWLRERGWDQGLNIAAATAMMAGDLLGLSDDQLSHALALAVTANVPVRQTRVGHLSMWKGAATGGAARNGVFAALLAARGMTGPPEPYVGRSGIFEQVTGPFEIALPVGADRAVIEDTAIKLRPAEFNAQGPIDLMVELRKDVGLDEIVDIEVATYWLAYHEIGMDRAKWDPQNRETADHSLPYLLAIALVDGYVDEMSCSPERVLDPTLRPIMNKIRIAERADFTTRFPNEFNVEITVRTAAGEPIVRAATYPHGHPRNPASDAEVEHKFTDLSLRAGLDSAVSSEIRDAVSALGEAPNLSGLMRPLGWLAAGTAGAASTSGRS